MTGLTITLRYQPTENSPVVSIERHIPDEQLCEAAHPDLDVEQAACEMWQQITDALS